MKIGFDAKRLYNNNTGLGNYCRTLVDNIHEFHPEYDITLFSPNTHKSKRQEKYTHFHVVDPKPFSSSLWRSRSIYREINDQKIDLYHGLSNEIPFTSNRIKATKIVTIHDLFYEKYPQDFSQIDRTIYKKKTEYSCRNADHIVAISEATKADITKYIGIEKSKISVIYQSCNSIFQTKGIVKKESILDSNGRQIPSEFMLFVGTLNHRKNILGLVNALSKIEKTKRIPLVIVGRGSTKFMKVLTEKITKCKLENEIYFCGQLENSSLKSLYKQARFTCLPSFYEGFGIPIIESLFSNTPVFASKNSSLIEATGPCGILIDPNSTEEMSDGLHSMIHGNDLIEGYKSMIMSHVSQFGSQFTSNAISSLYLSLRKN